MVHLGNLSNHPRSAPGPTFLLADLIAGKKQPGRELGSRQAPCFNPHCLLPAWSTRIPEQKEPQVVLTVGFGPCSLLLHTGTPGWDIRTGWLAGRAFFILAFYFPLRDTKIPTASIIPNEKNG